MSQQTNWVVPRSLRMKSGNSRNILTLVNASPFLSLKFCLKYFLVYSNGCNQLNLIPLVRWDDSIRAYIVFLFNDFQKQAPKQRLPDPCRSSHQTYSIRKDVLENIVKFTGKLFLWILRNFQEDLFYRTPLDDCFRIFHSQAITMEYYYWNKRKLMK